MAHELHGSSPLTLSRAMAPGICAAVSWNQPKSSSGAFSYGICRLSL